MQIELTPRQHQVVELLSFGMSNKKIADSLGITTYSVQTHLGYIYQKSFIGNRTCLAIEFITHNSRFTLKQQRIKVVKNKIRPLPLESRYGNWEVIRRVNTFQVECKCLTCSEVYTRSLGALRRGDSRQCKRCYLKARKSFNLVSSPCSLPQ